MFQPDLESNIFYYRSSTVSSPCSYHSEPLNKQTIPLSFLEGPYLRLQYTRLSPLAHMSSPFVLLFGGGLSPGSGRVSAISSLRGTASSCR